MPRSADDLVERSMRQFSPKTNAPSFHLTLMLTALVGIVLFPGLVPGHGAEELTDAPAMDSRQPAVYTIHPIDTKIDVAPA